MRHKAVLFDMDGVILDSEPLHAAAFQAVLKNHGHSLSEKQYKKHFAGRTDKEGFEQYFSYIDKPFDSPSILDEKTKTYLELATTQLQPYPGIVSFIRELSDIARLALVTGSLKAEAEIALKVFNIENCFDVIVAAEDTKKAKPDPEGYLKAVNSLGLSTRDCVVVEDSPSGVEAAQAAGVEVVAITNTHSPEELSDATKVVENLSIESFDTWR